MESCSSSRDNTRMRGLSLSKKATVPLEVKLCHRRWSPSSMSAAIIATIRPERRSPASLKPVSYLRNQRSGQVQRSWAVLQ